MSSGKIGRNTSVPVWCAWNVMKYMKGHIKKKKTQAEGFHCNIIPYEKNVVYWVTCARLALLVARSRLYVQAHSVTCRPPCDAAVPPTRAFCTTVILTHDDKSC